MSIHASLHIGPSIRSPHTFIYRLSWYSTYYHHGPKQISPMLIDVMPHGSSNWVLDGACWRTTRIICIFLHFPPGSQWKWQKGTSSASQRKHWTLLSWSRYVPILPGCPIERHACTHSPWPAVVIWLLLGPSRVWVLFDPAPFKHESHRISVWPKAWNQTVEGRH